MSGLGEAVRAHLRLYVLPPNVDAYYDGADTHDTVAERCAEGLAEAVLAHLRAVAADEGVRERVWYAAQEGIGSTTDLAMSAFLDRLDAEPTT